MGFQFFHSLLLWGLGLVLLPILIHLLRRRLVRRHKLPTFEFLLRTQRRMTTRSRLRNWILLALRVSAVAVVVLLSARPLLQMAGGESGSAWSPLHLVIVLDNSGSMAYRTASGTRLEVARKAAEGLIRDLSSSDRVTILATVGEQGEGPPPPLLRDQALARLASIGQTDAAGDTALAIRRALESLSIPADRRTVMVFSDFARGDWDKVRVQGLRRLTPHTQLQMVRVAPEAGTEDVLIGGVTLRPWPPRAGAPFSVSVRVVNRGGAAKERVPVSLYLGDDRIASSELSLQPGGDGGTSFRVRAPEKGVLLGRVELGPDALETTNRHHFAATMGQQLRVLLVDGDPQRGLLDSDTFYLASALRAAPPGGDSPMLVDVVAHYEIEKVKWEDYDFVASCNVGNWPPEAASSLQRFIESGGGFLMAGGDLAARSLPGGGWLPAVAGQPRPLSPPGHPAVPVNLQEHPVFAALGQNPGRFFSRVRIGKILPLSPSGQAVPLLTLTDGTPLLVAGPVGSGRAAIWAATCDRDWGDLPVHPVFVPFARGLVDFLGGRAKGRGSSFQDAGLPLEVRPSGAQEESVRIRNPRGEEIALRLETPRAPARPGPPAAPERPSPPPARQGSFTRTEQAGFYQVLFAGEAPQIIAVNPPASEGELDPLSESALRERLPGVRIAFSSIRAGEGNPARMVEGRTDLGPLLFLLLAGLLVVEGRLADHS
ncbi:MAG: BatA domain-containing protein [Candidatus Tectomicrobia bacterium]|uniref:BatA domain-containing protein n=1 Tax=Tectimicrobiota bacterium TaxID=2528274 RepID=A0A932MNQ0_UNCTE|nr:BatA domain-containing protein [Candidatus Tectomicrobia bacterium]